MQYQYEILVDNHDEAESIESAFEILGATHINQEGWPTSYGGAGIRMWATIHHRKKDIKDMVSCTQTGKLVNVKQVEEG